MKLRNNLLAAGVMLAAIVTGWSQPVITTQPQSTANCPGTTATFTVAATGSEPMAYQWQKWDPNLTDCADIAGCTDPCLVLTNVQGSDGNYYRVVVTNIEGATISYLAQLIVMSPPTMGAIVNSNPTVSCGADVTMRVSVGGYSSALQWCCDGLPLTGKTSSQLSLTAVQATNTGFYTVVASNSCGAATSAPVRLDVDATFTKIRTGAMVTDTTSYWLSKPGQISTATGNLMCSSLPMT